MKIAVTSCGIFLDSPIDPRFGRCDYFVIVNTNDMSFDVFDNTYKHLPQGAGVKSAEFVIAKGAQVIITRHVGPNAMSALSVAGVEVVICQDCSIKEAVLKYQKNELENLKGANVRDQYGMVGKSTKYRMREENMEFSTIFKRENDEGKEQHLPHMEIDKGHKSGRDIVRVVVGHDEAHPNTLEHHIAWIELYGVKKDGQVIHLGRVMCAPVFSNPNVRFQVNHIKDFQGFHSVAYCNIHGLWASSLER